MATDAGRRLLALVQREVVSALRDAVAEAVAAARDAAGQIGSIDPDAAFQGTAVAANVLTLIDSPGPVLALFANLAGSAGSTDGSVRLWRDQAAEAGIDGVAYVLRDGDAVAALVVRPTAPAPLLLRVAGFAGNRTIQLPLAAGFELRVAVSGDAGAAAVEIGPDGSPAIIELAVGTRVAVDLTRNGGRTELGIPGGPSVTIGSIRAGFALASTAADPFSRTAHLELEGGAVVLAPSFVRALVPVDLSFPLNMRFAVSPTAGLVLEGSSALQTRLAAAQAEAPGAVASAAHTVPEPKRFLDVGLEIADIIGSGRVDVSFSTSLETSLPGLPVGLRIDGIGLRLPIGLRPGLAVLPDPASVVAVDPKGAHVSLKVPVVNGSGGLTRVGEDLVGALTVSIPPMQASAFGVLSPAKDGRPLSLLVILGASFPPPGVQIGFGFAISGIGGVVGINRRIDRNALQRAVTDGSAAQLLFPSNPSAASRTAIDALPRLFPASRGSVVAGPMFQISWGGRLVTLSVAVLIESAAQVRLTILGKLVVAAPDPAAPLVLIQATFAGFIDPAEPSAMFVASLTGSHIVGAPLTGDVLLLTRGGKDATFVLSAGGFHPSFTPPHGVPVLRRLSMDLCPAPWIDLRCENYFAITSNTIQLGARLELRAEVAGCGLRGWLAFDALVQYEPFRFVADMSGGIALRAFGQTLVGIALALHLEGPAPYLARGRGSIDLFLFEASFDFEIGWGSPAPALAPPFDVGRRLRDQLAQPAAWRARSGLPVGVVLTDAARSALTDARLVDPAGSVSVRQEVVPLGLTIERINGVPVPAQRWDLAGGRFGSSTPADRTPEVRADFAPGMFLPTSSDDEAMTRPAYQSLRAGLELHPAPADGAEARTVSFDWEERVIARDLPRPAREGLGLLLELDALKVLATAARPDDPGWWAPPREVVTVNEQVPMVAAYAWSMTAVPGMVAGTGIELDQSLAGLAAADVVAVEAWEVVVA